MGNVISCASKAIVLELDSLHLNSSVSALKEVDFELAYLALLSREGIKPLSRWEKPLGDREMGLLRDSGLLAEQIKRTVKTGKELTETVFSASAGYVELYRERFADTPIDKSAATVRFEGFLFGYPPCCVERFIRQPYAQNDLDPQQQKILFHWACKGCVITPVLWPAYKSIHDFITALPATS